MKIEKKTNGKDITDTTHEWHVHASIRIPDSEKIVNIYETDK